jgi:hypothetical protein
MDKNNCPTERWVRSFNKISESSGGGRNTSKKAERGGGFLKINL